ncbi:MAG: heme/hemin ABC transporter substrate-binding protein [Pontibacterium sp.]
MSALILAAVHTRPSQALLRRFSFFTFVNIALFLVLPYTAFAHEQTVRIISTDAGATELLTSLGMEDHLVGVDVTSHLPEHLSHVANIGYHRNLSAEGLLSLEPTLVVGSEHIGPPAVLTALNEAKVPLVQMPGAQTTDQLRDNIRQLAEALGESSQGEALVQELSQAWMLVEPLPNDRFAFLLSMDDNKLRLAGEGTSGDAFIGLLKGQNVGQFKNYRTVSAESLLELAPTVILVAGRQQATAVSQLLAANPVLAHTPAGQSHRIVAVNGATLVAGLSVAAVGEAVRVVEQLAGHPLAPANP